MIEIPAIEVPTEDGTALVPAEPLPTAGIVRVECDGTVYRCYEEGDE